LQNVYKEIRDEGTEILSISSDTQAATKQTAQQIKASFPLLSDTKKQAIAAYNATDPLNPGIARPQYYIIDETGVIRWKFLDVRTGGRIDPAKIIEQLRKL